MNKTRSVNSKLSGTSTMENSLSKISIDSVFTEIAPSHELKPIPTTRHDNILGCIAPSATAIKRDVDQPKTKTPVTNLKQHTRCCTAEKHRSSTPNQSAAESHDQYACCSTRRQLYRLRTRVRKNGNQSPDGVDTLVAIPFYLSEATVLARHGFQVTNKPRRSLFWQTRDTAGRC